MREERSSSQILYGYLPEQTVDLQAKVWKVSGWRTPKKIIDVDTESLRRELLRQASRWRNTGMDGSYSDDLEKGKEISVYALSSENGVNVEIFPKIFQCRSCKRYLDSIDRKCQCGYQGNPGQLPFVFYHDKCGTIRPPWIKLCDEHHQVTIELPGTASAADIKFTCPVCKKLVRKGLGFLHCKTCGQGLMTANVHRAASVYTPHGIVIVNPPSREKTQKIKEAGGGGRALNWVIQGMSTKDVTDTPLTSSRLKAQLIAQGIPENIAIEMIRPAENSGIISKSEPDIALSSAKNSEAENQALTLAMATSGSRVTLQDLKERTSKNTKLEALYYDKYPKSIHRSGLVGIDYIHQFPIFSGSFAYTRGGADPDKSRLMPFLDKSGTYSIYGDLGDTEALLVRMSPMRIANWLKARGFEIGNYSDDVSARVAILKSTELQSYIHETPPDSCGGTLLSLIHSFAHRLLRLVAVLSGIERSSLSEFLVPLHLAFFLFAVPRGKFVLGGLQAVFENDLDRLLDSFVLEEHRCPLDPGCMKAGAACMACLHVGEPSCRLYNRYLNREFIKSILAS